jgi:hypothetical protein
MEKDPLISFYYKPQEEHPDFELIKLIKEKKSKEGKSVREIILEVLRIFYYPISDLRNEKYSEEERIEIWYKLIYELEQKKQFYLYISGLEDPSNRKITSKRNKKNVGLVSKPKGLETDEQEFYNSGVVYEEVEGL